MLRRFFVEGAIEAGRPCLITGPEAHHIGHVLRMRPGDRLAVLDGVGRRFEGVIHSVRRREVTVIPERPLPSPPSPALEIILCQAVLKSGPMDFVIQKTSELGIDALFPFFSERTVIRLSEDRSIGRLRHWTEIGKSAAKQSGRTSPVRIEVPSPFQALAAAWKDENGLKVILWEGESHRDLKALLKDSAPTDRFIGIIGPEGGFSEEEVNLAKDAGFIPVSLGNRILRSETAAIALAAIVQYEWGDIAPL